MSVYEKTYTDSFYSLVDATAVGSADVVTGLMVELMHPASVVDVGCGTGAWLVAFQRRGVADVFGVDGDWVKPEKLLISPNEFLSYDLTKRLQLNRRFDLAISLEVGEHLPASSAQTLVQSLVALSDVVLFSAAVPDQGGYHHVNEQWPEYWAKLFSLNGYVPVDYIRNKVWDDPRVTWWYAQNILIYVAESRLHDYPALKPHQVRNQSPVLTRIHPRFFSLVTSEQTVRKAAGALLRALSRSISFRLSRAFRRRAKS